MMSKYVIYRIRDILISLLNYFFSFYTTYHLRPKFSKNISVSHKIDNNSTIKFGIVIQGPVISRDSFTIETVKLYKTLYPHCLVLVSTWEDENLKNIACIEKAGGVCLLNKKPLDGGYLNVNYQIESSKNGIAMAKKMGVEYVIKTRTDQRMYGHNILLFLYNLIREFPLDKSFVKNQKMRMAFCSLNSFKYRMYGISDMFLFGHIDDVLRYWSPEYDNRKFTKGYVTDKIINIRAFAEWNVCEVYFCTNYLKSIGYEPKWTLEDSYKILSNLFISVDSTSLDIMWPKYTFKEHRWTSYESDPGKIELTFKEWINIKNFTYNYDQEECILEKYS